MLKSVLKLIKNLEPDLIIQAPSRINLINPLDAVEGAFWMPSVAIEGVEKPLSVFLFIKRVQKRGSLIIYDVIIEQGKYILKINHKKEIKKRIEDLHVDDNGLFRLVYASIYRLSKTNRTFWNRFVKENLDIGIINTIPRQSGLGGSASIIIAVLFGLATFFDLINNFTNLQEGEMVINKDIIAELATIIEDKDLQITAGYSDRYLICRGGLSFCSYVGKLEHKKISMEPLAVYDRIDKTYNIKELPIIVCFSGVIHQSGDIHKRLRKLFLKGDLTMIKHYKELAEISWKSRFALMNHDLELLGKYFKVNTEIMNKVMLHAGFNYGIGLANNILIKLIEDHPNVYAVKLTGAGGGGSVFALVNPEKLNDVLLSWKEKLNQIIENESIFKNLFPHFPVTVCKDLIKAQFYRIRINKTGVREI